MQWRKKKGKRKLTSCNWARIRKLKGRMKEGEENVHVYVKTASD